MMRVDFFAITERVRLFRGGFHQTIRREDLNDPGSFAGEFIFQLGAERAASLSFPLHAAIHFPAPGRAGETVYYLPDQDQQGKQQITLAVTREREPVPIGICDFETGDHLQISHVSGDKVIAFQVKPRHIHTTPEMLAVLLEQALDHARAKSRDLDAEQMQDGIGELLHVVPKAEFTIVRAPKLGETLRVSCCPQSNEQVHVSGTTGRWCQIGLFADMADPTRSQQIAYAKVLVVRVQPSGGKTVPVDYLGNSKT